MNDTTHLDYLESFVPAAILLAGHGPDWQNHHRLGRDVEVPGALLEALCPGLEELMQVYPGKLVIFRHLMVCLIQVLFGHMTHKVGRHRDAKWPVGQCSMAVLGRLLHNNIAFDCH